MQVAYQQSFQVCYPADTAFLRRLMEIMQMTLTTSRKAETIDLVANIGGVTAGIVIAHIALKILRKLGLSGPPQES